MTPARLPRIRWLVGTVTAVVAAGVAFSLGTQAAAAEVLTVSPTGSFVVQMRGNGHGHGLSQYGARGAAIAGRSYSQIVGFYYPGTTLVTLPTNPLIRVRLSGTGTTTTVAAASTMTLTGMSGVLPTAGISKYRIIAGGHAGLVLEKLGTAKGSTWTTVRTALPNQAQFERAGGAVIRVYLSDGTSTYYYGRVRSARISAWGTTGGVSSINVVGYNKYAAGVTPREMPASWQRAAVDAQAVAARTYGAYAVAHPQSSTYDICDTTQCQVYGGHAHYSAAGALLWSDDVPAATDTSDRLLEYKGAAIFSQFSASNGGWTVNGGQPYMPAEADPYDAAASGDPYLDYTKTVTVASVARDFGLAKVTKVAVSTRDGHGTWGGRVLTGYVTGTDSKGKAKTVHTTGFDFADAFGAGTTWFELVAKK
jgi:SpoIID/LytB domain protein